MTATGTENEGIDLKRFNQVFFEECAENLAEMEQILISLGDRQPDHEQLNAIFRAAHSIKGGAGIFGFDDMTVVTHIMESLLDRLRNDQIPFAATMIDLFLEAGDVISMQLAGHREGTQVRKEAIDGVSRKLQQLIDANAPPEAPARAPSQAPVTGADGPASPKRYELVFTPDPDIFRRGIRLEGMVSELRGLALGGAFTSRAVLPDLPGLDGFDPESCITRWHFTLTTAAALEQIVEVFMFVAEEEQLSIRELPPPPKRHRPANRTGARTSPSRTPPPEGAPTTATSSPPTPSAGARARPTPPSGSTSPRWIS